MFSPFVKPGIDPTLLLKQEQTFLKESSNRGTVAMKVEQSMKRRLKWWTFSYVNSGLLARVFEMNSIWGLLYLNFVDNSSGFFHILNTESNNLFLKIGLVQFLWQFIE